MDPKTGSRRRKNLSIIESMEASDQIPVVIRLKKSFSPFLSYLVGVYGAIIPKECVAPDGKVVASHGHRPIHLSWSG
jgi:hypothetical protein